MAMLAALAYVVMSVTRLPLMAAAPYLKYDPKDVVLVIGGFLYGPGAAAAMSLTVCLLEMFTVSESGIVGFLMNFMASTAFIVPAAFFYHKKRTIHGAVVGLLCGVVLMTGTMLLWNWIITPFYEKIPREVVEAMLVPVFLPFNLVKGGMNMALSVLLYQPVNNALRRMHLLPALPDGKVRRRLNPAVLAFGALLLVVCVVIVLKMLGKI
jgi:riboflavin transporter FmnP